MSKYSYIPPEYKTNTNNMSTSTRHATPPRTHQTYNYAANSRALDHSPSNTGEYASSHPIYWADPSPWELEMAMSPPKPKRKPKPMMFTSPSPWEYEVAMSMSERKPKPKTKTDRYTSNFREVGLNDFTEYRTAGYRSEPEPDYRTAGYRFEHTAGCRSEPEPDYHYESEHRKGGKMAQVVKDISKRFHTTGAKK